VGGALVNVGAQALSDIVHSNEFDWDNYISAAVGGAVGGELLLYFGPVASGAAGAATTNLTRQTLRLVKGKQDGIDVGDFLVETGVGAGAGLLRSLKLPGINSGRNSYNAIYKQIVTKAKNGTIKSVTIKTATKMFIGRAADTALAQGDVLADESVIAIQGISSELFAKKKTALPSLSPELAPKLGPLFPDDLLLPHLPRLRSAPDGGRLPQTPEVLPDDLLLPRQRQFVPSPKGDYLPQLPKLVSTNK
jgi:hypothetical protein